MSWQLPEKRKYMNIVTLSFAGNCHGFPFPIDEGYLVFLTDDIVSHMRQLFCSIQNIRYIRMRNFSEDDEELTCITE